MFALASLCQEYQVQWIIDEIESYISHEIRFEDETYQSKLRFLKLTSMMGFNQSVEELIQVLDKSFQVLKMTEEFTWLNTSTKILITRKCLFELGEKIQVGRRPTLNNRNRSSPVEQFKKKFKFVVALKGWVWRNSV